MDREEPLESNKTKTTYNFSSYLFKQSVGGKKMKIKTVLLAILSLILCGSGVALGASDTANVTLSATIVSTASLTLSTTTITFESAELPPTAMQATENGATVTATFRTASTAPGVLTVLAADDLINTVTATDIIPITTVKSTATNAVGSFFLAGPVTWSKASGVTVGTGQSGDYSGTFSWAMDNSWNYATGTYTTTAVYTLTSP